MKDETDRLRLKSEEVGGGVETTWTRFKTIPKFIMAQKTRAKNKWTITLVGKKLAPLFAHRHCRFENKNMNFLGWIFTPPACGKTPQVHTGGAGFASIAFGGRRTALRTLFKRQRKAPDTHVREKVGRLKKSVSQLTCPQRSARRLFSLIKEKAVAKAKGETFLCVAFPIRI